MLAVCAVVVFVVIFIVLVVCVVSACRVVLLSVCLCSKYSAVVDLCSQVCVMWFVVVFVWDVLPALCDADFVYVLGCFVL